MYQTTALLTPETISTFLFADKVTFLQVCGQWCWKSGHACIGEAYCLQCYSCDHFR